MRTGVPLSGAGKLPEAQRGAWQRSFPHAFCGNTALPPRYVGLRLLASRAMRQNNPRCLGYSWATLLWRLHYLIHTATLPKPKFTAHHSSA